MKKIALSLAVLATIALASCGNKAAENADTTAADTTMQAPEMGGDTTQPGDTAMIQETVEQTTVTETAAPADAKAEVKDATKDEPKADAAKEEAKPEETKN